MTLGSTRVISSPKESKTTSFHLGAGISMEPATFWERTLFDGGDGGLHGQPSPALENYRGLSKATVGTHCLWSSSFAYCMII
jgi:hypothetical protein